MKLKYEVKSWFNRSFSPPDDDDGSPLDVLDEDLPGGDGDPDPEPESDDDQVDDDASADDDDADPDGKPAKGKVPALTSESIALALKGVLEPVLAARQPQPGSDEPPMTKEEAKKMLKYFEPDDDFIAKINNVETAKEGFIMLRDALTQQQAMITQVLIQRAMDQVHQQYAPLLKANETSRIEKFESGFTSKYPQLADEAFKPIIGAVLDGIAKQGKKFGSDAELHKVLAKGVEAVVQRVSPEFKLTPAANNAAGSKKPGNQNALKSARVGSGKGGVLGRGSGDAPKKNVVLSILG